MDNKTLYVVDNIAPKVTQLSETPAEPVVYVYDGVYSINATVIDVNLETVLLEFNGVNYTATNMI